MLNNGQAKKELIAHVFDRAATGYGQLSYLPPFGVALVEFARIRPGSMWLDVATGRGAALFAAIEQVGQNGEVIGIDLSEEMVRQTLTEAQRRGLRNVKLLPMDAEALEFPDTMFDGVLCAFGLFFFPHVQTALAEFRRVLKPAGTLAVSTWMDEDARWDWYDDLVIKYGATVSLRTEMLDQSRDMHDTLDRAGFSDIEIITQEHDWVFADEETWWTAQWSISARAGLERLAAHDLAQLKAETFDRMQSLKQVDGFHCRLQALLARAVKR